MELLREWVSEWVESVYTVIHVFILSFLSVSLSLSSADNYLLQVQEYSSSSSTTPTAPQPPKTTEDAKPAAAPPTTAPPTEQSKWYDVDVIKGTQYVVTAYQVPVEDPTTVSGRGLIQVVVAMGS